jgi:hypothetical protein
MTDCRTNLITAMTDDHYNFPRAAPMEAGDAGLDHGSISKGQQRLEGAHAPRTPRGEQHCGNSRPVVQDVEEASAPPVYLRAITLKRSSA